MNIREAILAAAGHIERNPREFDFFSVVTPSGRGCGTPGCAVGWIAACYGAPSYFDGKRIRIRDQSKALLGVGPETFYSRLDVFNEDWKWHADKCARALRLYADKYHPATEPAYPNWQAIATGPEKVKDSARDQALDWVRA